MMKKRWVSLLLTFTMLLSLVVVPANAAVVDGTATLTITPDKTEVMGGSNDVEIIYTITLTPPTGKPVGPFQFTLVAPEGMTLSETKLKAKEKGGNGYWLNTAELRYDEEEETGIYKSIDYNAAGHVFGAYGLEDRSLTGEVDVMTIKATVAAGYTGSFTLEASDVTVGVNGTDEYSVSVSTTSVTVVKAPIAAASATIAAPTKGQAFPSTVAAGATSYTASVAWFTDEACTKAAGDTVRGGQTYYAKITLTPDTANGESFADSVTVTVGESGFEACTPDANGNIVVVVPFTTAARVLDSIAITTAPTKTAYEVGDSFDTAGMVVTANYDDGTSQVITDYTYAPNGALAATDTAVTVSYSDKQTAQTITVSKKTPTTPGYTNGSATYDGTTDYAETAKAAISGFTESVMGTLDIIFKLGNNTVEKLVDAGVYTVSVKSDGNDTYSPLPETELGTFTVDKAAITPTVSLTGWTYGGTANTPSVSGNSGNGAVTYSYKAKDAEDSTYDAKMPTDAGSYTVKAVVAESDNYLGGQDTADFTIAKATVTAPAIAGKTYTGEKLTADVAESDVYTIVNNGGTNVGNYDVVLTLKDSANYKWSDSDNAAKTLTFTISKATASAVATPTPAAVTYDPAKTLANVTLPQGWSWSAPATVPTVVNSGYSAVLTVDDANYDYTGVEGYNATAHTVTRTVSLTVNPADSVAATVTANNRTYDGTQQALVTVSDTAVGGDMEYRLNDGDWSTSIPAATAAGKYTVAYRVNADSNHSTFIGLLPLEVTIAPKAVTITANNAAKTFGQSDPALTATVSGTVGSDVIAATASRATGNDVGEYAITAAIDAGNSSYNADNYDITFVNGKFTISQADNSISNLSISGWTYGDSANAPSATAAFGTVAYTYGASQNGPFIATVPTNAGTWYVKAAVEATANYKSAENVTNFTIAQRQVTLNWGTSEFTYDGQPHAPTAEAGNLKSGDTVNVTVNGEQTDAGNDYTATASITNGNYKLPENATHSFSIAKATIAQAQLSGEMTVRSNSAKAVTFTLPALPEGASYGTPAIGTNTHGLISAAEPTVSGTTLSFSVTSQVKDKTATITVPVSGGKNYSDATYTLTVTSKDKDDAGVTVAAGSSTVTYGDSLTVSGSANAQAGSGTWTWSSSNSAVVAVSGTGANPTVTVKGVGEATITGTFENDDYLGSNTATVTVTQREVTLTWGAAAFTYDGKPHVPSVTLGNVKTGDTVNVTVTGEQTDAGSNYTATAASLDNGNYKLPEAKTRSFTIAKANAAVTAAPTAQKLTYTGSAQALVSEGTATGGAMQYSLDGTSYSDAIPTGTDAGSYTVYYKVVGDSNHNDTAPAFVTVTIAKASAGYNAPTAQELTYNGQAQALLTAGSTSDGTMQYRLGNGAWGTTVPTATNAGTYTVYYKVTGDKNHNNVTEKSVSVAIARKAVTVTADNASKVYGAADPGSFTATVSGTVGNDKVTYTLSRAAGDNVGTYDITASGKATQGNYDVTFVKGTFTITKATNAVSNLTISGWTYGDKANAPSAKATFGTVAYTYSNAESGPFTATVPVNAGTWYVKAAVAGNDNYDGAEAVKSFTIARKAVTITANNATKVYGESDPTLTVTVTGVVSGDTIPASAVRAAGNNVNSYTISVNVSTQGNYLPDNYTITTVPGTFTITPKAVTVTANDAEKTYGEKDPVLSATVTGLLGEDFVTYDVSREEGENAGTYTITASGAANQGNYAVTYVAGKFTVKPLTGEEVVAGEGVSQMEDSQTKDFTEDLAQVEQFTDEAVGIQEGDSDDVKQEKREAAVKSALVSASGASAANTSGLYFVSANNAAASQIVLAVPNGAANSSRFNYKVMYMAANGAVTEVPSQVTANGIVADLAQGADGVYMVAYTPKPVHIVDDSATVSGGQSIITDLTDINKVTVDGKTVDPKYYTVSGGVVTLSEAYLRTLSNGKHTVRVENAKYISTAVITVSNAAVKSAGTGDAGLGLYAMLALSSVTGAAWLGLKKRKED